MTDRLGYVDREAAERARARPIGGRPPLPPVLSWSILCALAIIIIGMAYAPFAGGDRRFLVGAVVAIGFFTLYGLVKRAAVIRGR